MGGLWFVNSSFYRTLLSSNCDEVKAFTFVEHRQITKDEFSTLKHNAVHTAGSIVVLFFQIHFRIKNENFSVKHQSNVFSALRFQ